MPTLGEIMKEAARNAGFFWEGTTSAIGSPASLKDDALIDSERPATMGKGGFLYLPGIATAGDKLRRISGVAPGTGIITNAGKPYANAASYAAAVEYQWYGLVPPRQQPGEAFSWHEAVNRGLAKVWYEDFDQTMTGVEGAQDRFDVSDIPGVTHAKQIRGVEFRQVLSGTVTTYSDDKINSGGGFWKRTGPTEILVHPAPATTDYVRFRYVRPYVLRGVDDLVDDTDETGCPLDVAWKAAISELYQYMDDRFGGRWAGESARSLIQFTQAYSRIRPEDIILWV